MCICKRIQEIIYVNIRMCAYVPHQWKMTPHQWKCGALKKLRVTPSSGNIELDPTSGN